MASLDNRLAALEAGAHATRFSLEEKQHVWQLMVWQARLKLVGVDDRPPEPSPEWLAEMNRDIAGEDMRRIRDKLLAKFPEWREQFEALSDVEVCALNYDWSTWARQEQLLPGGGQLCLDVFLKHAVEVLACPSATV
jgi:hypothetical protein